MNTERTEIARRFVACSKWVWLPGMLTSHGFRLDRAERGADGKWSLRGCPGTHNDRHDHLPDLDDDLTRLGVLAVVRRAWSDLLVFVAYDDDSMNYAEVQPFGVWLPSIPGPLPIAVGPTEESAMLAALEAAPT